MSLLAPTTAQIQAQVEAILKKDPNARALAILSPGRESWPQRIDCAGRPFALTWCESTLEARQALVTAEGTDGVVLLTPLSETVLGEDVLARLAKPRLLRVETWEMVREAFQARNIDPRISGKAWLAELLLENGNQRPYPPVAGGLLDADTAWHHVLERALGFAVARPDVDGLLKWALGNGNLKAFNDLRAEARTEIAAWLADAAGPVGRLIMAAVQTGQGADALPLGLVAGVVFGEGWTGTELTAAAVRMEPFVGGRRIEAEHGRAWETAAIRVLRGLDDEAKARSLLERADMLLQQVHASNHAVSSSVLLSGFEARLNNFAADLRTATTDLRRDRLAALEASGQKVLEHDQARRQKARAERVAMALRLVRWLAAGVSPATSFTDAVLGYARDGAFVDWARLTLAGGDELAPLSAAYADLVTAVREIRQRQNAGFAKHLQHWNGFPSQGWPVIPVERLLDEIVAPLAHTAPVLLLVMDGLSLAVYRELTSDLANSGWTEMMPSDREGCAYGVAMLPTLTEISRASLLCGRPTRGNSATEKTGFGEHAGLRAASKAGHPPALFHKGELAEAGGLSAAVREALGDQGQRVVGIVYNAIDDYLSGPEQLRQRWTLDDMRLLRPILHEARTAGRVVIITADHGHLLEAGSQAIGEGDGDRWRHPQGSVRSQEMHFVKGRVLTPVGENAVVLPWSESVRYSVRKNGYHGGASPQEVLVPVAVLSSTGEVSGWTIAPPVQPDWWEPAAVLEEVPQFSLPAPSAGRRRTSSQPSLFETIAPTTGKLAADWIDKLLASPVYAAQKQLAGRGAPKDEDVRNVLSSLSERGGKLSRTALAQRLGVPQLRVGGLVMSVRRVVNVDQAPVLVIEEASGTIVLNRKLLDIQFCL